MQARRECAAAVAAMIKSAEELRAADDSSAQAAIEWGGRRARSTKHEARHESCDDETRWSYSLQAAVDWEPVARASLFVCVRFAQASEWQLFSRRVGVTLERCIRHSIRRLDKNPTSTRLWMSGG